MAMVRVYLSAPVGESGTNWIDIDEHERGRLEQAKPGTFVRVGEWRIRPEHIIATSPAPEPRTPRVDSIG